MPIPCRSEKSSQHIAVADEQDFYLISHNLSKWRKALYQGISGILHSAGYRRTNRYLSIKDMLECMRISARRRLKVPCLPAWAARLAAPISESIAKAEGSRPLLTRYSLSVLESGAHFCHDKATMGLGFHPRDIAITIYDTIVYLMGQKPALA